MIGYNELYELLRKEKYSEGLQPLPKKLLTDFKEFLDSNTDSAPTGKNLFVESTEKSKKQFENSIAIFKELILRRKKKMLQLAFVATETGIMKRDYDNMLAVENQVFEKLIKAFEEQDREIASVLHGEKEKIETNKLILFKQDIEQFVDHLGNVIGPFKSGELANLDSNISEILVSDKKAGFIDEN